MNIRQRKFLKKEFNNNLNKYLQYLQEEKRRIKVMDFY